MIADEYFFGSQDVYLFSAGTLGEIFEPDHPIMQGVNSLQSPFIRDNFPERYALKDKDGILDPEAIAENYWQLHRQPRSAWTHELDLRPWIEKW